MTQKTVICHSSLEPEFTKMDKDIVFDRNYQVTDKDHWYIIETAQSTSQPSKTPGI